MQGSCKFLRHKLCCVLHSPPANMLWPSPCVLCYHPLMLVDFPGNHSVVTNIQILQHLPTALASLNLSATMVLLFCPKWTQSALLWKAYCTTSSAIIETTTCPVHSLCVWLINDVTSRDWVKAWASRFNRVKTMAPKHHSPVIQHLL